MRSVVGRGRRKRGSGEGHHVDSCEKSVVGIEFAKDEDDGK
jgi:hypothetical protein